MTMNTSEACPKNHPSSKPLPVRLDPVPVDERAMYIDSICRVLIDSRFGQGRTPPPFEVHYSEYLESVVDLDVLCDLMIDRTNPLCAFLPMGRRGHQVVDAGHRTPNQMDLTGPPQTEHNSNRSPSCLARGSP